MSDAEIRQIQNQCEINEQFLKELIGGKYAYRHNYLQDELRFGVARRWNSWYPSYFNVRGGCYVLIPGDWDFYNDANARESRTGVIVIDPGFNFIDILRETYQIEPQDISTVIVTHFHPDHMIGLIEYATIMKTSKQHSNIYLNETTFTTFKSLQSEYNNIHELRDSQIQEIMRYNTIHGDIVKVTVKAIGVHHNELGNQHRSLGLVLETTRFEKDMSVIVSQYSIGILGDTDGNIDYIPHYVSNFKDADILILHLGTFSDKDCGKGGKHLYKEGVKNILGQMRSIGHSKKKIVVLSEFGLELADEYSLYQNLQPFIESHFWRLPIIYAHLDLNKKEEREYSHFFARASLAILERVYKPSMSLLSRSHQELTKTEREELLVAIVFQALIFNNNENFKNSIRKLYRDIDRHVRKVQREQILTELPQEYYLRLIDNDSTSFEELGEIYKGMIKKADFASTALPVRHLTESCNILVKEIARNFENPLDVIRYIDKLIYIRKYSESRGVKDYQWLYGNNDTISTLGIFWTVCLVGVLLLKKELERYDPSPAKKPEDIPLIRIKDYFQEETDSNTKLIIGDIGCTFGIDTLDGQEHKEREPGLKIKSFDGDWITPEDAICKYDPDNERISYFRI